MGKHQERASQKEQKVSINRLQALLCKASAGWPAGLLAVLALGLGGCASVSENSVALSADVGSRVAEMQGLHRAAVAGYFDAEELRVVQFMTNQWEPLFLQNFLGMSGILSDLSSPSQFSEAKRAQLRDAAALYLTDDEEAEGVADALVSALDRARGNEPQVVSEVLGDFVEDDQLSAAVTHLGALLATDEPARMIMDFAQDAHNEISRQHELLMQPIRTARAEVMAELDIAYGQLLAAQNLITGRLAAASRVRDQQDQALDKLLGEGQTEHIRERLAQVSAAVSDAIASAADLAEPVLDNPLSQGTRRGELLESLEDFRRRLAEREQ